MAELGIGFVPFGPLGKGFLTGTVNRRRRSQTARSGEPSPASRPRTWPRTRRWWTTSPGSPARVRRPAKSRWPGCWPAAVDRADPRHPAS